MFKELLEVLLPYDGTPRPGRVAGQEGLSIEFTVRSPDLTSTTPRMYVMYTLAEGQIDGNDFTMAPLTEVVLQVVP